MHYQTCPAWNATRKTDDRAQCNEWEQGYGTAQREQKIIGLIRSGVHGVEEIAELSGYTQTQVERTIKNLSAAGVVQNAVRKQMIRELMTYETKWQSSLEALLKHSDNTDAGESVGLSANTVSRHLGFAKNAAMKEGYLPPEGSRWELT